MLNLLDNDQTTMIPPPSLVLHHHVGSTLTSTIPVVTSGRGEERCSLFTPLEMNLVNSLRLPARGGSKTSGCAPRLARGWQQPSGRRYSSPGHSLPTQQQDETINRCARVGAVSDMRGGEKHSSDSPTLQAPACSTSATPTLKACCPSRRAASPSVRPSRSAG